MTSAFGGHGLGGAVTPGTPGTPITPGTPGTYPESRVLIIMTGGTICMRPSPDGLVPMDGFLEHAMAPRPSFNDTTAAPSTVPAVRDGERIELASLRTPVSAYARHIRYGVLEFTPLLDSSSISSMGWTAIAEAVRDNYHLFDGFVVLHGTDSLAYTASALSFMMADLGKPVILTGSQASIFALQSDAVDNLLGSLIVAGTFVIPEVCLFFHHTLFRGNRTTKVSASAFEAFASPNAAPLARVTSLGVDVAWPLVRRPTRIAEFRITRYLDTAHVACFRIFPGLLPEMLDAVLRAPTLRGLILETFGMGNAPGGVDGSLTRVIREAVQRGVVVVNVSQCTNGFVSPLYAPATALGRAGVVFGHDLTTEAALTKLSYLLALDGLSYAEITARMGRSLRGEMSVLRAPVFSHPAGATEAGDDGDGGDETASGGRVPPFHEPFIFPGALRRPTAVESAFTALGYAIRNGDLATVRSVLPQPGTSSSGSSRRSSTDDTALASSAQALSVTAAATPAAPATTPASTPAPPPVPTAASALLREHAYELLKTADYAGNTALHLAAVGPDTEVLRALLRSGASVHVRNRANNTPLFLAEKTGRTANVQLLREAGAHLWDGEEALARAERERAAQGVEDSL